MKEQLAIFGGKMTISSIEKQFPRPKITDTIRQVILDQLEKTISISDWWWVIEEFENKFKEYHHTNFALTCNSWTSALRAIYEWLELQPWDEVLCPTYTFFATISPLIYMGVRPVFCDCLDNGTINPEEIEKKITNKTKAIAITHLRWIPCEMDEICTIAKKYWLKLVEDCSHAHWAEYHNQKVWTFWDASAWSLQGQKIITWGELWILTTNDHHIYTRALLLWQYNKRCIKELPSNEFSLTGMGLKLRAHTLAVALANEQFDHLDNWITQKNLFAQRIINALEPISFLSIPSFTGKKPSRYSMPVYYDQDKANTIPLDIFVKLLHAEWLSQVDMPLSTRPIHQEPLFTSPQNILPGRYSNIDTISSKEQYANADNIRKKTMKFPVWTSGDEEKITNLYIQWIQKVAYHILHNPQNLSSL